MKLRELERLLSRQVTLDGSSAANTLSIMEEESPHSVRRARRALSYLNAQTFGRIPQLEDKETLSLCAEAWVELTRVMNRQEAAAHANVTGESIDGWSRSYASPESCQRMMEQEMKSVLREYLGETGLLFRGMETW